MKTDIDTIPYSEQELRTGRIGMAARKRRTAVELAILLPICTLWFLWGTNVGTFVGTEALRAVVVKEMLQNDHWLMPTIHGRPYVRKPPLYAWTTATLARAVDTFNEQIARLPAVAMALLYVLTIYLAARWLIDERAGPAAAVLAAGNWYVLDYGSRAELDSGVLALTSMAVLLILYAYSHVGRPRIIAMAAAYAAALAGSFWKAPHVLLAVWLTVAALAWMDRRAQRERGLRFARHPLQIGLSLACVAILSLWFMVLARSVGGASAGKFVLIEFIARVLPHSLDYITNFFARLPEFPMVVLPAGLFAAIWLWPGYRDNLPAQQRENLRLLGAWFVPLFFFLLFVPAKAPRYWFLILGAVTLMAVFSWRRYVTGQCTGHEERRINQIVRLNLYFGSAVGVALMILAAVLLVGPWSWRALEVTWAATVAGCSGILLLTGAVLGLKMAAVGWHDRLGLIFIAMLLALKPPHVALMIPLRAQIESLYPTAVAVDQHLPTDATLYVLSDKPGSLRTGEMADLGYYCKHTILWPPDIDDALADCDGRYCYVLAKKEARQRLEQQFAARIERIGAFPWADCDIYLMRVDETAKAQAE